MTEEELKRLRELPVPAPAEGAREAAVAAALAAFDAAPGAGRAIELAGAPADAPSGTPQGNGGPHRLRSTSAISEGILKMRFRRPVAIAASVALLALVVPIALRVAQAPSTRHPEQLPGDRVAALPEPAPVQPPLPAVASAPSAAPPAAAGRVASAGPASADKGGVCVDGRPCEVVPLHRQAGAAPVSGGAKSARRDIDREHATAPPAVTTDQSPPLSLQAQSIAYEGTSNRVIARGNVEIRYNGYVLTADQVTYDGSANTLTAEGNAQLKDPSGAVTRADRLQASDDFRDAFVRAITAPGSGRLLVAEADLRSNGNAASKVAQEAEPKVAALPAPSTAAPALTDGRPAAGPREEKAGAIQSGKHFRKAGEQPASAAPQVPVRPAIALRPPPTGAATSARVPSGREPHGPVLGYAGERARDAAPDGRDRFAAAAANGVKSVASEPVSTFSIDVDSASYAFVRRALNAAQLPPKDAVRVEEMINYFPYDYPLPADRSAPFRPTVTVLPSPWNPANKLVHIAIKGYDLPKAERPRSNLVLLIDTSGSMATEDRLPLLKNAFRMLVDTLRPDDTVGIVTYAGQTHTALEPTKAAEKRKILEAIERLEARGSTAGGAGIQEAYRMAEGAFDKAAVNRVILATDGDFNVGITGVDELKALIERKRETGIYLSVLGVGRGNYNDAMMQALAQNGNGVAAYIDTLSEARKVLVDEASSTLFPIAKDVKIQVEFNPGAVSEYRLIGYETRLLRREDFNNDKVDAGDIGSGHTVTAIYEVTPVGSPRFVEDLRYKQPAATPAKDDKGEYGFLRINYKLPAEAVSRRIELAITPALEKASIDQGPTDVRFSIAVAAFGQLLRGEPYLKSFGYDEVIALAAGARGDDLYGYRAEFLNLVRLAKSARP